LRAGVPAAQGRRLSELPRDPELHAVLQCYERNGSTPYYTSGRLAQFSRTPQTEILHAPGLGEHTREVLLDAGLTAVEIDRLVSSEAIAEGPGIVMPATFLAYR
jgi:formyl-CoA transferase